jgi:hypothetical protein
MVPKGSFGVTVATVGIAGFGWAMWGITAAIVLALLTAAPTEASGLLPRRQPRPAR